MIRRVQVEDVSFSETIRSLGCARSRILSTAEAEYIAMGSCCTQLMRMKQMSADYGVDSRWFLVCCNNKYAIDISKNPVQHSRTKHIDSRHHFIRELVDEQQVVTEHVVT